MTDPSFWPQEPGPFAASGERYVAAHDEARRIAARLGVAAPSAGLLAAAELDGARAAFHAGYARLVEETRARMTEDVAEEARRRSAELAAGHGAAVGGMGPMTALGALGRADGVHRAAHYSVPAAAPADLDVRLRELCGSVTGPARQWVRMAVGEVVDENGRLWRLIGTTELDGYLRPGVVLRDGELAAGNEVWPELSIATFCAAHGFAPGPVVGAVEPPPDVCQYLRDAGFTPTWTTDAWSTTWEDADAPLD